MNKKTLITGFPRIGEKRELKRTLENYWKRQISNEDLENQAFELRKKHWLYQKENNIDFISCNDFSLYDNMLDTVVMLDAIPKRFRNIENELERYFAMARGSKDSSAMEMTKWFNTNYHYIVPELSDDIKFGANTSKIESEYKEMIQLNIKPKINIIGPLTFLSLSKTKDSKDVFDYFEDILKAYEKVIEKISNLNSEEDIYLQIEEPIFVKDLDVNIFGFLKQAYNRLSSVKSNIKIIITTYFEHSIELVRTLYSLPVWGIGLDFIYGEGNFEALKFLKGRDIRLIAGVVDGRNIWKNNFEKSLEILKKINQLIDKDKMIISSSCSFLHVPYSIENEPYNDNNKWFSFACEKVKEISLISKVFHKEKLSKEEKLLLKENNSLMKKRRKNSNNEIIYKEREGTFSERMSIQKEILKLPHLSITTIGSFPQTAELRKLRSDFKKKFISKETYEKGIKSYIDYCVEFQENINIDVLVHGEPERNDMVEYFGENLEGFHFTRSGWVQSYGNRCVKPPIIYDDILRKKPITVKWITYAQSKTEKIVKGMLTGPVTILNWSFVRDDKPRYEVANQIANALSDEINDLQLEGIKIIQVDEAAFKEGYPLRINNIKRYEEWAVKNFKTAVSTAKPETQIHTHMCYSEFNDIIKTIENLDADVITIENARSGNEILNVFKETGYKNELGPGVYDIHSPRIPEVNEISQQINSYLEIFPIEKIWINPDCGLKTRTWKETELSLKNMVLATMEIRKKLNIS
jgi:5-methyltetrahydropteroyltriglutamate--homocysteine methyltransferase